MHHSHGDLPQLTVEGLVHRVAIGDVGNDPSNLANAAANSPSVVASARSRWNSSAHDH